MLTKIEKFILGGNVAHDLISLEKYERQWEIEVESCKNHERKVFVFPEASEEYEQLILAPDETLKFPLPIIGFECFARKGSKWRFLLNASEVEWAFISNWPHQILKNYPP